MPLWLIFLPIYKNIYTHCYGTPIVVTCILFALMIPDMCLELDWSPPLVRPEGLMTGANYREVIEENLPQTAVTRD